ncbi:MAG TPA: hypothetical protein VNW68_06235 [Candidatus Limnocylindria bacterium]|nr:hypothetical protein [Candidatus Limnocylindria bacterium]
MEHFVVRLWVATSASGESDGFHGTATHVRSGVEQAFTSEGQLVDFMRRTADAVRQGDGRQEPPAITPPVAESEQPL